MNKDSIYGLTFGDLVSWLMTYGHKRFRALQVWDWLYRKRVTRFSQMLDVNQGCLQLLEEKFSIQTIEEYCRQEAVDGTIKFLFTLADGHLIETVLMRHKFGLSVCVTTQVGCNMGCSFCASGLLTKKRDVSTAEMVEQIMKVNQYLAASQQGENVSHVVVMGIGEPLDNFENVVDFLEIIRERRGLAIAGRKITVSTSGLVDKIYSFADEKIEANLAISLHAPNNELRTKLMKINRAFPIETVMQAVEYYLANTKRRITLEYILLKDINDGSEHALELAQLIGSHKQRVNVNLIPYNTVGEHSVYQRSTQAAMRLFYDVLRKQGIHCSNRLEHGADIDAACGQLRSKQLQGAYCES